MWSVIVTVGLKLIGWFLKDGEAKAEAKKKFLEFVQKRKGYHRGPSDSRNEELKQREKLKNGASTDGQN